MIESEQPDTARLTFTVLDDFHDDPDEVRAFALSCEYVTAWGSWSGLHSLERALDTKTSLFRIAALVSRKSPNWEEIDASYNFWKKAACGSFAASFESQSGVIHAHRRSGDWAGVIYMSRQADCEGRQGTIFYRHKETGLESVSQVDEEIIRRVSEDARNVAAWEITRIVPMQYNRLVVFDSRYLHSASPGFGSRIDNCRLIQVFNFCLQQ